MYKRMYEIQNTRPYYTSLSILSLGAPLEELTGFRYRKNVYLTSSQMHTAVYYDAQELSEATAYFKEFFTNRDKLKKLFKDINGKFKIAQRFEKAGWKQDWGKKSDEELLEAMSSYGALVSELIGTLLVSQPQHVESLEERIRGLLHDVNEKEAIIKIATYWKGVLPWSKEGVEIKKLQGRWSAMPEEKREQALEDLSKKYGWFNEVEGDGPFDKDHYWKLVLDKAPEAVAMPRNKFAISSEVREIGSLIGELGYLRVWSRYHFMHVRYHLKRILLALSDRLHQPLLDLASLDEVEGLFKNKDFDAGKLKERMNGYATILVDDRAVILTGDEAQKYRDALVEKIKTVDEIKGRTANLGKVSGIARIIDFSASDYNEQVKAFKDGEILVTGMTRPQIIHLCKKAKAIVTDEGGITSHAAIVSREFNIPCVIATGDATKIIKTGYMVEVDADKGVVKILECK
jgi:phosphoenolpyruvate synthase/pyruvate phosphate dikinase